jgi:hypothetical protein
VWLEGLGQLKNPITLSGTEPAIYPKKYKAEMEKH